MSAIVDVETNRVLQAGHVGFGDRARPRTGKRDVRDAYVSHDGALRDYEVMIAGDPHRYLERLEIDHEATAAARLHRSESLAGAPRLTG